MFYIWDDRGIRLPYRPGSLHARRIERVQPIRSLKRLGPSPHPPSPTTSASQSGVAAYQEEVASEATSSPTPVPLLAKHLMTSPVVTLPPSASLAEAWVLIREKRFRHIPIVSSHQNLVGILSDRDLFHATIELAEASGRGSTHGPSTPVARLMVTQVLSASPETELRSIARVMFEEHIGAVPLVDDQDELVGILTRSDLLRSIVNTVPFESWA